MPSVQIRMNKVIIIAMYFVGFAVHAQDSVDHDMRQFLSNAQNTGILQGDGTGLDPYRIINESYNFLKEVEPEMTSAEYALYERVVPMAISRPEYAITLLENMLADQDEVSSAFKYVLANVYMNSERAEDAERLYKESVIDYPDFMRAWQNLGLLYYTQNRFKEAIPCFSQTIALGNRQAEIYGFIGYCLGKINNQYAAEAAYQQALAIEPFNVDWIEGILNLQLNSKQFDRVESLLKQLILIESRNEAHWLLYANVLVQLDRRVEAIGLLQTAVGLGLDNEDSLVMLGDLCAEQKFISEAMESYNSLMADNVNLGASRIVSFANVLIEDGKLTEARRLLDEVPEELPEVIMVKYLNSESRYFKGMDDIEKSKNALEQIVRLQPLNGEALLSLGTIYKDSGDTSRAIFTFEQTYALEEFVYFSSLELANIYLEDKDYEKSLGYLRDANSIERSTFLQEYIEKISLLIINPK